MWHVIHLSPCSGLQIKAELKGAFASGNSVSKEANSVSHKRLTSKNTVWRQSSEQLHSMRKVAAWECRLERWWGEAKIDLMCQWYQIVIAWLNCLSLPDVLESPGCWSSPVRLYHSGSIPPNVGEWWPNQPVLPCSPAAMSSTSSL